MSRLQLGDRIRHHVFGGESIVEAVLGEGGQGIVLKGRNLSEDSSNAVKWYHPHQATDDQWRGLEALIRMGAPNDRFLWPSDLVISDRHPGFGYIMPIREARFRSLVDLMTRRCDPSYRVLTTAAFELAHGFLQLHARGLAYRDISFGNAFLDPDTGEVRICDTDNIGIDGESRSGVLGTPAFMAPEIVTGEAQPSTSTDLHSLAVLLFYLLVVHHPLEGAREAAVKCLDLPARQRLYGSEALFIFDPHDASNRPVPELQRNAIECWPVLPTFVRELFTRAFTTGLKDPNARVRESEWRLAMLKLRDSLFDCAACGAENFVDEANIGGRCWSCAKRLGSPVIIRIGRSRVVLTERTALYPHHLSVGSQFDFSAPVATLTRHPTQGFWGLMNGSSSTWSAESPGGSSVSIPSSRSIALRSGLKINFGTSVGIIE